jgi:dipeptidyl aminopeptidase/acylaminoacyl peptidase
MTENDGDWRITTADALAGVRFAEQLPAEIDWDRVILLGFSAGGHLALWAAAHDLGFSLRAVFSLAGAIDLRLGAELGIGNGVVQEFLCDATDATFLAASPKEQTPIKTPVRIVHGSDDQTVPLAVSRSYQKQAHSAGMDCDMLILEGGDHFSVIDPTTQFWPTVEDHLLR